ncbi:prolipoprotein diacylglyceryl transferase [Dinghuibacter silviterrae]|uniref:Phosphatidylglycerol:prolipoprotein diacylglycerol transferase n=1 Tax=Dinghuibacter silviterrae TaxID=1539049 RepID=A0A4R8DG31_9BACT|nr:prolipoprotein diacylglyceryl transferase family protein [Dinghuibacter silviterrae]TDW96318.1 phosphatidylglycerol:prolipoprotein diacylglycerol transferase [Dinghuibacter silviterrae]
MYPTLSYLIHDLTGLDVNLPVPTFGFVVALSFWAAYWVFTREFKRKMAMGGIPPLSVHRLMDTLLLCCGVLGFAGAVLLAMIEDPHGFHYNGLNYYGGLIFGSLTYLVITRFKGIPFAVAADIGSPGMMLAYGLGRIGCHLSGDGDWGTVHTAPAPYWLPAWAWGCRYPHNVIHEGAYIPGCGGAYCTELVEPVYPTSLYEAIACLLLFAWLWFLRRRITRPGLLFALFAFLVGTERFLIEFIRVTPRYAFLGLSQAQYISLLYIGLSIFMYFYALKSGSNAKIVPIKT